MRNRSSEFRDRRFLQSAAFVAEGLNSLALDLHRVLDPAATEREWKRHYRGDKGLFTRRLVGTQDRARIAALYETDGDFRRFVDLYVNEFESLMQTAGQADQENMLMGVFLSADVGKLYLMLCEALGHKPAGARPFALGA